jgi:uncharacterized protein (DUF433 family)
MKACPPEEIDYWCGVRQEGQALIPTSEVIVKDQDILGGTPVFRGTRVPFQALLDYLEGGQTLDEFLDDFPTVTREAAIAALEFAKSLLVGHLG